MLKKTIKHMLYWPNIFWLAGKRLYLEQFTYSASALAFATLLSLVPLLSVLVSIITVFPVFTKFIQLTQNYIFTNFIPTSNSINIIQKYLLEFINQASRLPTFSIIFLLFTAITLIMMVEHCLNDIWGAPKRQKKFRAMFIYWIVLLLAPIFIGFSIFLSTYLFSIHWFSGATTKLGLKSPLLASLPLLINTFIFTALYVVVPNFKVKFRDGIIGGFIASLLFEAAKKAFAIYIKHFPSYELIYGTLATFPIFLMWIYISWLVILYGALVTHTHYLKRK